MRYAKSGSTLLFAGLFILLSACTTMRSDFDPPEVTVTAFRPVTVDGSALSFEIDLRVVNPNADPLPIKGIAYSATLGGHRLLTGVAKDLPTIDGYSEGSYTLPASASMFEALQLFADLAQNPSDAIAYEIETKLDLGTFIPPIRVDQSGEISLQIPQR